MLTNYLKIAWRNVIKNRAYALINITGLALGIGSAMLVFALVRYHYRIDTHHQKYDRIYRVTSKFLSPAGEFHTPGVPYPFGKALRNDYPGIENLAMIDQEEEPVVAIPVSNGPDKKFKETEAMGAFVEPTYFRIFDYEWLAGGPTDLNQPNTVVISAKNAQKYFGRTANLVGRTIKYNGRLNLRIVGVFADYQDNTDFPYQIMPSWASLKEYQGHTDEDFGNTNSSTPKTSTTSQPITEGVK